MNEQIPDDKEKRGKSKFRRVFYGFLGIICFLVLALSLSINRGSRPWYEGVSPLKIKQALGFKLSTPYRNINGCNQEVITIENIVPGGVFDRAGFENGDVLLGYSYLDDFYKILHDGQGLEPVNIEVHRLVRKPGKTRTSWEKVKISVRIPIYEKNTN